MGGRSIHLKGSYQRVESHWARIEDTGGIDMQHQPLSFPTFPPSSVSLQIFLFFPGIVFFRFPLFHFLSFLAVKSRSPPRLCFLFIWLVHYFSIVLLYIQYGTSAEDKQIHSDVCSLLTYEDGLSSLLELLTPM
jgi:hypothetical protein